MSVGPTTIGFPSQLPEGWHYVPGRRIVQLYGGALTDPNCDPDAPYDYYKVDDLNQRGGLYLGPSENRIECLPTSLIEPPVVMIPKRGAAIATNKVRISARPCLFDSNIMGLRCAPNCDPRFLSYVLLARGLWDIADVSTVPQINNKHIKPLLFPLPCHTVQRAIADFLDRKTKAIDEVIRKKQSMIELIEDRRFTEITTAVTRGFDCHSPVKSAGLEWAGPIPEHWTVAPLGSRYLVQLGKMLDEKRITGQDLHPYLRNVDVQWDTINTEDLPQMDFDRDDQARFRLEVGDLLVCEGGEIGRSAIWTGQVPECYYQKALHRVRLSKPGQVPRFLFYLMIAAAHRGAFLAGANPNTIDHLTGVRLRRFRFPFPPEEEQRQIANRLDRVSAHLEQVARLSMREIERIGEYRHALITAAVTGQIPISCGAGS